VLLEHALSPDPQVAKAALSALSRTATAAEASALLKALTLAKDEGVIQEATVACSRALGKEANLNVRSSMVRNGISNARTPQLRATLIALLPECADSSAWRAVRDATGDPNTTVRSAALEAACEWPNMDAWDTLLESYRTPGNPAERANALRALTRLAAEANVKPDNRLMKGYENLFTAARTDGETRQILSALSGAAHPAALDMALLEFAKPGVRAEAAAAIRKIAESIKATHPEAARKALDQLAAVKQ